MITYKKKGILLLPGILLLQFTIYSCTSSVEPTPHKTYSLVSSRNTQTNSNPTITRGGKGICENRRGAALFEEIPPIDPAGKIAYSAEGIFLINPTNNVIETVYPLERNKYLGRNYNLAWSPDGTMLSINHHWSGELGFSLEVVDFTNGEVCSLIEGRGELSNPAWSPDSRNLSVVDKKTRELINIECHEKKVTILANSVYSSPQWIDNSHIAYILWNLNTELSSLVSLDITTKEVIEYFKESKVSYFLFSPDGNELAYTSWDQFVMNITNIKNGITNTVNAYIPFDWTTNGRTLLAETAGQSLVFINLDETITVHPVRIGGVCTKQAFSSDDSMVVINKVSDGASKSSIVIINITTNERKSLNMTYCCPQFPVWNPIP